MQKKIRIEQIVFLWRNLVILILKNRVTSRLRIGLKKMVPEKVVRNFDGFRKTSSERRYEKISNDIDDIECAEHHSDDSISFLVGDLLNKYKLDGVRPCMRSIQGLDSDSLSTDQWLQAYFSFFSNGLVSESAVLRSKAVARSIQKHEQVPGDLKRDHRAMSAMMELGWDVKKIKSTMGGLSSELDPIIQAGFSRYQKNVSNNIKDEKYAKMVSGKRIAILGPAASKMLDVEELRQYDLLITTNEHGCNPLANEFIASGKCISYYNSYHSKLLHQERTIRPYNTKLFSIYRSFEYDYQVYQAVRDHARLIHRNDYFFNGVPQAFQAILHDLSYFEFSEIKAFGFDLYTSEHPYRSGYQSPTHRVLYDLGRHDLISNFLYAKSFYDSGRLKADDSLHRVLTLSLTEYLERVESCIVHW
ncbi:hypothetical protein [Neptunomonas antarctica]|uniref:Uncharacterized protein n=1 Tax=Neptunomonas antarctica TaxID=619304 RepID=A0A1N7JD55_9GAMM|nr:hypothetical protein [Neptunomonas antarctica]SIS47283.1 hypothetical protein SAMN05421760_101981 [Neptunomonas antarctica]